MAAAVRDPDCIFCKIIDKSSPSWTVIETDKVICFLDIFPVSKGHSVFFFMIDLLFLLFLNC